MPACGRWGHKFWEAPPQTDEASSHESLRIPLVGKDSGRQASLPRRRRALEPVGKDGWGMQNIDVGFPAATNLRIEIGKVRSCLDQAGLRPSLQFTRGGWS